MSTQREPDIVTDFDIFMAELRAIPQGEFTLRRVEQLVASLRGKRIYVRQGDFEWPHRLRMASHLLSSGIGRAEAARTLAATLDVSESTAYRILQSALDSQRRSPASVEQKDLFR